ncbi:hypothetical protein CEXT_782561 [Caerostris extrusa]|uniref:Uncharacterized protein n=1 Tax=Caerostris extrusa TaxID=172846 RepID=A0AAV4MHR4_CAEEX|nr:hypothetical protein CEXT_782561 [Caerostris extrusa]
MDSRGEAVSGCLVCYLDRYLQWDTMSLKRILYPTASTGFINRPADHHLRASEEESLWGGIEGHDYRPHQLKEKKKEERGMGAAENWPVSRQWAKLGYSSSGPKSAIRVKNDDGAAHSSSFFVEQFSLEQISSAALLLLAGTFFFFFFFLFFLHRT